MPKRLFDFDRTIAVQNTFKAFDKAKHASKTDKEMYEMGKQHAIMNTRFKVGEFLIHDDAKNAAAVVTFHNNSYFIAGYLSYILKKELICDDIEYPEMNEIDLAIARFQVEGLKRPLFIAFIDQQGDSFIKAVLRLKNKNTHIEAVKTKFEQYKILTNDPIEFYDDDEQNIKASLALKDIKSHWVSVESLGFSIKEIQDGIIKSPSTQALHHHGVFSASRGLTESTKLGNNYSSPCM